AVAIQHHQAGRLDVAEEICREVLAAVPDHVDALHLLGVIASLPFVPDWRWLLDRSDSPWYPRMRLFRQKKLGDWEGVFEEIRAAISERVQSSRFKVQG